MSILLIVIMGTSVLPAANSASFIINQQHSEEQLQSRRDPLTVVIARGHQEVTVHRLGDRSQRVAGLQGVVAVVDVRRVLEGQAALQIVLVEVHLGSDVLVLEDLLLLVEPAELGEGVTPDRELDAGVVALLGLCQSQDDWRNCGEGGRKGTTSFTRQIIILGTLTLHS